MNVAKGDVVDASDSSYVQVKSLEARLLYMGYGI